MLHRHASVRIPTRRIDHGQIAHTAGNPKQSNSMATQLASYPRSVYIAFIFGIALTFLNLIQLYSIQQKSEILVKDVNAAKSPIAWVRGEKMKSGYLSIVVTVLERLGYKVVAGKRFNGSRFDLLWNHEYPFTIKKLEPYLASLKAYQKVNHIPGSGYYTSKVSLATADISEGIPKAFEMPLKKDEFLKYAEEHPDLLWVKKNNEHRGILVQKLNDIRFEDSDYFLQQYVFNPLLIDGRKFDVGVYVVVTSVSPLRVYVYEGDILLRFCNQNYNPFDPKTPEKYVVGDDYTPTWEIPSLKPYYVDQQLTFRQTLSAFIASVDGDFDSIWESMKETIAEVFQSQQKNMIEASKKFSDKRPFFELSRFDFLIDTTFKIYLMEANLSPNLSAAHFPQNRLLYEQVLYNLFSLVGVANHLHGNNFETNFKDKKIREMEVSNRDIVSSSDDCAEVCNAKEQCKKKVKCQLCSNCLSYAHKTILKSAYVEHLSKRMFRRVLPVTMHKPKHVNKMYSEADRMLILWFDEKCQKDKSWCY